MNFSETVLKILEQGNVSGDVYGSESTSKSSVFSSDNVYNPKDARLPKGPYSIAKRGLIAKYTNIKKRKLKKKK